MSLGSNKNAKKMYCQIIYIQNKLLNNIRHEYLTMSDMQKNTT